MLRMKREPTKGSPKKNRRGRQHNFWISVKLDDAFQAWADAEELTPNKSVAFRTALREFLQKRGRWTDADTAEDKKDD